MGREGWLGKERERRGGASGQRAKAGRARCRKGVAGMGGLRAGKGAGARERRLRSQEGGEWEGSALKGESWKEEGSGLAAGSGGQESWP